jgi:hypothetical protein
MPRCAGTDAARWSAGVELDDPSKNEDGLIQIELRLNGSMPAGVVTDGRGGSRDFTGWVGLMSAVDALAMGDGNRMSDEGKP